MTIEGLFVVNGPINLKKLKKNHSKRFNAQELSVDLFNLKIYALLMCPGSSKVKADFLFDLIMGPQLQT